MDVLQWIDTGFRAVAAGFFALLPGMTVWAVVLSLYSLVQWIIRSRSHNSLGAKGQTP
jgi:hypothetical protein